MARGGHSTEHPGPLRNGVFMIVVDIARFVPPESFRSEVDDLVRYLKTCPTVPGTEAILAPGEPEAIMEKERRRLGIFVEDQTWQQIQEIGRDLGVNVPNT